MNFHRMGYVVNNNLPKCSTFDKPVDFVIPWSGLNHEHFDKKDLLDIRRHRYNNELFFCIKGIINNAPWYEKIIIFLDFKEDLYKIIPEETCKLYNILPIERGIFFNKENYPTNNSCVIYSIIHKIKELNEHFILISDDIIINNKTKKGQWFSDDGKPYILYADCFNGFKLFGSFKPHDIYVNKSVFKGNTPLTFGLWTHMPIILLKSVCIELADNYKEWYAFIQTHKTRYSSTGDDRMWGLEEDIQGVWSYLLYKSKRGILHLMNFRSKHVLIEFFRSKNFNNDMDTYNPMFVNFNDATQEDKKEITTKAMEYVTKDTKINLLKTNRHHY